MLRYKFTKNEARPRLLAEISEPDPGNGEHYKVGQIDSIDLSAYVDGGLPLNNSTVTLPWNSVAVVHINDSLETAVCDNRVPTNRLTPVSIISCSNTTCDVEIACINSKALALSASFTQPIRLLSPLGRSTHTRAELPIPASHCRESSYKAGQKSHMHTRVFDRFQEDSTRNSSSNHEPNGGSNASQSFFGRKQLSWNAASHTHPTLLNHIDELLSVRYHGCHTTGFYNCGYGAAKQ